MGHLIKYRLKMTLKEPTSMFWALFFPIILGTLFYFTFGKNYTVTENLETIPVAVVENVDSEYGTAFLEVMKQLDEDILKFTAMNQDEAEYLLQSGEIKGIYFLDQDISLTIGAKGIEESILQVILDSYRSNAAMIGDIAKHYPERLPDVWKGLESFPDAIKEVSLGGKSLDTATQYFFALIAMTCMYGCFLGLQNASELKANQSALGARRSISPTHRLKLVFADMLVTIGIHFANVVIILLYLRFILKIGLGDDWGSILLICLMGSTVGVCLGLWVGCVIKKAYGVKLGILIGISMVCSFLAGLMFAQMKDIIEKSYPIINRINPAALIADLFYFISVYDDPVRFTQNMITLGGMSIAFVILGFLAVRRERYESI